jgi:hypothetical protein
VSYPQKNKTFPCQNLSQIIAEPSLRRIRVWLEGCREMRRLLGIPVNFKARPIARRAKVGLIQRRKKDWLMSGASFNHLTRCGELPDRAKINVSSCFFCVSHSHGSSAAKEPLIPRNVSLCEHSELELTIASLLVSLQLHVIGNRRKCD